MDLGAVTRKRRCRTGALGHRPGSVRHGPRGRVAVVDAAQFAEARTIAPVTAVQDRHAGEMGLLVECEEAGIAHVRCFPLGGGGSPLGTVRPGKVAARPGAPTARARSPR